VPSLIYQVDDGPVFFPLLQIEVSILWHDVES
jgi:hypothetical protein